MCPTLPAGGGSGGAGSGGGRPGGGSSGGSPGGGTTNIAPGGSVSSPKNIFPSGVSAGARSKSYLVTNQ